MKLTDWITFGRKKNIEKEIAKALGSMSVRSFEYPLSGLDPFSQSSNLRIYDQMQNDAQVRASINLKKLGIIAAPWKLIPADDTPNAKEITRFIEFCFAKMNGSITAVLWKAMDAFSKGFSILEQIYDCQTSANYQGKLVLKSVKAKDPSLYGFEVDEYLNPTQLKLYIPGEEPQTLPRDKFIIYVHNPRYENPWGESDLKAAYQHWFAKTNLLKFWAIYLEKYGSPTVMGTYKRGLPPSAQDDLLSVLEQLHKESAIVVPEDVQVHLLQTLQSGGRGFMEAVEYHNKEIARAILGQTLTTDEGSRVGSLALGVVHFHVMLLQLQSIRRELAENVITEQVIKPLVQLNYGVDDYPRFVFEEANLPAFVTGEIKT